MATLAEDGPPKGKLVIKNIGTLLSGELEQPILDADTIVAVDGRIRAVGKAKDIDAEQADVVVDAKGTTVAPGLIDSHVHPVFGDWTPRQSQLGWIDSFLHGGVTTMISAGEVHLPGRPRDVVGVKALAITAQRAFSSFRPGGVKVHAGAPVLEKGMVEDDFKEMAAAGVKLLGEVGLGGVKQGEEAKRMVAWARKYGIQSTIHTGGPSIPGSGLIDADVVLEADADVIGHINGGHTALPIAQIRCLCEQCTRGDRGRAQRQCARRALCDAHRDRTPPTGADHPRHRSARRLRRAAARHPADDRDAEQHRGDRRRDRVLLRDRQHRAPARARLRPDRARPRGRLRDHGPGPAHRRQDALGERPDGRSARRQHGDHRRCGPLWPLAQHAARDHARRAHPNVNRKRRIGTLGSLVR